MRSPQEKLLGIFLAHDEQLANKYLRDIESEWFDLALHKKVFGAIKDLHKTQQPINVMTVIRYLREKKMIEGSMIGQISGFSADHMDALMIESIIGEVHFQHNQRVVSLFLAATSRKLADGNFLEDEFLTQYSDLNDTLRGTVTEHKSNAESIEDVLISHDKAKNGEIDGLELGFTALHKKLLLENVDLMIVAARPAMGKTAFAVSVMCLLAVEFNIKVAFFSLEMSKTQMLRRITANLANIDSNKIKYGDCDKRELGVIKSLQTRPELDNMFIYEGSHTSDDIIRICTRLKHDEGIELIIVDYLQKMTSKDKKQSRYDDVSDHSNDLKFMCQNLQIPCIALSQLSRSVEQRGGDKRPYLSDLKQSGDIEQDATVVSFLYRPEYYGFHEDENGNSTKGMCELIIAKYREGGLGTFKFNISLPTSKFTTHEGDTIISSEQGEVPF